MASSLLSGNPFHFTVTAATVSLRLWLSLMSSSGDINTGRSLGYCNCSQNTRESQRFHSGLKDWRRHKACQSRLHDNSDIYYTSLLFGLFERAVLTNFANFFIEQSIRNQEAISLLGKSWEMRAGGVGVHTDPSKMGRRSLVDIWPSSAVINAASCSWGQFLQLWCLSVTARTMSPTTMLTLRFHAHRHEGKSARWTTHGYTGRPTNAKGKQINHFHL